MQRRAIVEATKGPSVHPSAPPVLQSWAGSVQSSILSDYIIGRSLPMFFFDLTTWGVVGLVAFVTVSKGDVRHFSRGLGYYTGRAIGFFQVFRESFLSNSPLWQLHSELSQSVMQLHAVRSDFRQTTQGFGAAGHRLAAGSAHGDGTEGRPGDRSPTQDPLPDAGTPRAGPSAAAPRFVPGMWERAGATETSRSPPLQGSPEKRAWDPEPPGRPVGYLGVSAGELQRANHHTQGVKCGSDILADALDEEEVAVLASQYLRQMARPPGSPESPMPGNSGPRE